MIVLILTNYIHCASCYLAVVEVEYPSRTLATAFISGVLATFFFFLVFLLVLGTPLLEFIRLETKLGIDSELSWRPSIGILGGKFLEILEIISRSVYS